MTGPGPAVHLGPAALIPGGNAKRQPGSAAAATPDLSVLSITPCTGSNSVPVGRYPPDWRRSLPYGPLERRRTVVRYGRLELGMSLPSLRTLPARRVRGQQLWRGSVPGQRVARASRDFQCWPERGSPSGEQIWALARHGSAGLCRRGRPAVHRARWTTGGRTRLAASALRAARGVASRKIRIDQLGVSCRSARGRKAPSRSRA